MAIRTGSINTIHIPMGLDLHEHLQSFLGRNDVMKTGGVFCGLIIHSKKD